MEKLKRIKIYNIELPIFLFFAAVILAAAYLGALPLEMIGAIAIMFVLGIVLGEIGERIPIWKTYCGGGAVLVFVVT